MSMKPPFIHVLALCALVLSGAEACRKAAGPEPAAKAAHEPGETHEEIPGRVTLTAAAISEAGIATWEVKPVDLEHLLVLTGSVEYDENRLLQVASNVRGRVIAIPVDLGAWVRKGDALMVLESLELGKAREEFLRETSTLRVTSRAYERAKALVAAKAISSGEFQAREG
jgi:cobalt-zinc-cadmium efflux system membrane fusion protein